MLVEGKGCARINDLCAESDFVKQPGCAERNVHHAAGCDNGDIGSRALDVRDAKGDGVFFGRHWALEIVHHFVFEKGDGVIVADSRLEQAFGVVRGRGQDDLEARDVAQPGV